MRTVLKPLLLSSTLVLAPFAAYAQSETPQTEQAPAAGSSSDGAQNGSGETAEEPAEASSSSQAQDESAGSASAPQASQSRTIGASGLAQVVDTLSPLVEDVQVVGPWEREGQTGVWRAVMARDPGDPTKSEFFIQQIAPSSGGAQIAQSIRVNEIGALGGAVVGYTADEPAEGQEGSLTLFFEILPDDGEIAETYELRVQPDGAYDFGYATN